MSILDLRSVANIIQFGNCCGNEIGWAQANAVQNQWYDISDSDMVDGQLYGVTHDGSGKLTVVKAGKYTADLSGAFEGDANGVHVQVGFSVNGTVDETCLNHIETIGSNRQSAASIPGALDLAVGDTVAVSIRTTDAGTPDLAVDHLMLRLEHTGIV